MLLVLVEGKNYSCCLPVGLYYQQSESFYGISVESKDDLGFHARQKEILACADYCLYSGNELSNYDDGKHGLRPVHLHSILELAILELSVLELSVLELSVLIHPVLDQSVG